MTAKNFRLAVKTSTGEYELTFDFVVINQKGMTFNFHSKESYYSWNWKKVELKVYLLGVLVPYSKFEVRETVELGEHYYKFIILD